MASLGFLFCFSVFKEELPNLNELYIFYSQAPHQFPPTLPPGQNLRNLPHPYATLKYKNEVNHEDNGIIDKFTDNVSDIQFGSMKLILVVFIEFCLYHF